MMAATTTMSMLLIDEPVDVLGIPGGVEFSELGPDRVADEPTMLLPEVENSAPGI